MSEVGCDKPSVVLAGQDREVVTMDVRAPAEIRQHLVSPRSDVGNSLAVQRLVVRRDNLLGRYETVLRGQDVNPVRSQIVRVCKRLGEQRALVEVAGPS